jgi:hypothetical protein
MRTLCALCGKPLVELETGGFLRCHKGLGYMTDEGPLPADEWAGHKLKNGWWLFIRPGFPRKR